jgi:hypothetical protein
MAVDWMAVHGPALVEMGYPIIPIIPGAKCPGTFRQSTGWQAYSDWPRHNARPTKALELGIWSQWPGCGIGMPCGTIGGLDLDVLDAEISAELRKLAFLELGETPAERIGLAPKRLLVYRMAEPFAKVANSPLEFLGLGQQFVCYGIHPDTQKPYQWPLEDLSEIFPSRLPFVTEAQVRGFMTKAMAILPPEMRQNSFGLDRGGDYYYAQGGEKRGTVAAMADALQWLPNDDVDYKSWLTVCMSLKAGLGEAGWPLFAKWSARASKDVPAYTAKTWRTMTQPHSMGAGTIYGWALERGWVPDNELILNGAVADARNAGAGNELFANLVAQSAALPPPEALPAAVPADTTGSIAAIVAAAPGSIGRMTQWMVATAVSPQPLLSLGASLCALGVTMGRKYRLAQPDTRSNVYVIALADSGGGKDHPRRCVRRAMTEAGLASYLGGETLASGSAVLSSVAQHPCRLFQVDEFGHFIQAVLDPKSHAHHRREIMTNLTTLWSSASEIVIGTEYANQRERPRVDIHEPCVCVYGSTVPMTFWQALQSGSVTDGSVARFLVLQTPKNYPDDQTPEPIGARLAAIVADLKAIAAGAAAHTQGNLGMVSSSAAEPYSVPMAADAEAADMALRVEHLVMKRQHENTMFSPIVARFREHIRRVALIAAVSDNPAEPVMTAAHFDWAAAFVRWTQSELLEQSERFIADSQHEAGLKKLLDIIRRHGGWMDGHTLAKKTQFLNRRDRNEQISQLEEAGEIEKSREEGTTKPRLLIRARG